MGLDVGSSARVAGRVHVIHAIAASVLAGASVVALTQLSGVASAAATEPPPSTAVIVPSTGATDSGSFILDAAASSPLGIATVTFAITGGALSAEVISTATPTLFGWIGKWNTTSFPNGTYAVQSVATDVNGQSTTSAAINVTVSNPMPAATLQGNGSIGQAWLTGAQPGDRLVLLRYGSFVLDSANPGTADPYGSLIIRDLQPGPGYSWWDRSTGQRTSTFPVLAPGQNPPTSSALYTNQALHQGLNYITMRDGVSLAATVRYPSGSTCTATAPCPTVMEYSGYGVAGPTDPIPSIDSVLGVHCTTCGNANLLPDSATDVGAVVARISGSPPSVSRCAAPDAQGVPWISWDTRRTTTLRRD